MQDDSIFLAEALYVQANYPAERDTARSVHLRTHEPYFSIEPFDDCIDSSPRARIPEEPMIYPMHQSGKCTDPEASIMGR